MSQRNLDPSSAAGSMRAPRVRSKSPSGTRRKPIGGSEESSGAVLYVQKPDETIAEEHELDNIGSSHETGLTDALGVGTSRSWQTAPTGSVDQEPYSTQGEGDSQLTRRRHRDTAPAPPRTDTSDSEDRQDAQSLWSQDGTHVLRRNLTTFDVAALIFNKMVGSGIFTTPGAVLALTGSKPISVGLWAVGGIYTMICMFIYLEYGIALPFTGGELIYLDEIFCRPQVLATIIFSGFFLFLANSTGNSLTFAKHVLVASLPDTKTTTDFDERLVRFIAIAILTTICLLHYFSGKLGLFLNKLLALYKILLLFSVFVAGIAVSKQSGSGKADWYEKHGPDGHTNRADSLAASVLILYSYQGWENANYVAGEIKTPNKYLKRGAFLAVGMVTVLYILVATAYYMACDYATITRQDTDLGMAIIFGPKVFGGTGLAFKVSIALSAAGNLVAVIYTSSKVKQAIARQGFIPFHEFFAADWNIPKGGLILQWFTSMLMIAFTPNTADGYSFVVGIFTYCHLIITIFIAIGTFWLRKRMEHFIPNYSLEFLGRKWVLTLTVIVFIGMNMLAVTYGAKPRAPGKIPRFWWPVLFFIVLAASCLYWLGFWLLQVRTKSGESFGKKVGFEVIVHNETDQVWPEEMKGALAQSRLDGTRRRTQYKYGGMFLSIGKAYRATVDTVGEWFF